eukprot:122950_1
MTDEVEKQRILNTSQNYTIKGGKQRKDSLLTWRQKYTIPCSTNYDHHQDTMNITNKKQKSSKSLLSFVNNKLQKSHNKTTNYFEWKHESVASFRDQSSDIIWKPNSKLCHTSTDIGNALIMIGGMSKQCAECEILEMKKDLKRIHKLTNLTGDYPCCRWGHTASYIAPLHAIIMIGGFDSTYNWNDIRLLFLSTNNKFGAWYQLSNRSNMDCKALHSSTVRYVKIINKQKKLQRNLCEVYVFGGQFCDGGPYEYNNDVFRIQFYDELKALDGKIQNENKYVSENENIYDGKKKPFVQTNTVSTWSENEKYPPPRSQHFAFIDKTNNRYCIYGGLDSNTEFNDLWYLDLITKEWNEIKYSIHNILNPPNVNALNAHNFRLNLYGDKFFYSSNQNKLLVMHCVGDEDSLIRSARMISAMKTFKEIMNNRKMDVNDDIKNDEKDNDKKQEELSMSIQTKVIQTAEILKRIKDNIYWIYIFDLERKIWDILVDIGKEKPQAEITGAVMHRIGDRLWLIGGKDQGAAVRINRLNNVKGISFPTISISWKVEREIWIGNLKNDNNKQCYIKYLPKEIIGVVLSFFKQNVW